VKPWIVAIMLVCCGVVPSQAEILKNGRLFYLRGSLGYGSQTLGDVNDGIREDEQIFISGGVPVRFDTFGGALDVGAEFGFRLARVLSLGVGVNYQKNDVNNAYSDLSGEFRDDVTLKIVDVSGNVTLWVPDTGLFFGASAGVGLGKLDEFISFIIYGDPTSSFSVSAKGKGNGFVAGVFGGYDAEFSSGLLVFGKVGYRFRNLGNFDADAQSPELGSSSGPVRNNAGRPIDFDFSGAYVSVGVGVSLGKAVQ
jgi:hypothetical protein